MLKIEFPAENKALAAVIGRALSEYADTPRLAPLHTALERAANVADADEAASQEAFQAKHDAQAPSPDDEPTNDAPADGRKDQKGVVFNPTFCANAREPFYSSGATLGQWKKARGCDQGAYDAWYSNELGKVQANWQEKSTDLGVSTNAAAAAFSSQAAIPPAAPVTPTSGGELMKWVSERQAAGVLNQADTDAAWAATGFGVADLFGPNAAAVLASVYAILSAKAGA